MLSFGRLSPSVHGTRSLPTLERRAEQKQPAEMTSAADRAGWSVTRLLVCREKGGQYNGGVREGCDR